MDFEEELFHLYQAEAEQSRQEFITEHGYSDVSEMTRSDRSFYDINRANIVKGARRRFDDRLNCGGYAFEITSRLYPPKDNDYSKYVSVVDTVNEKDVVSSKIKGSQVPSQIPNITGAGLNRLK